MRSPQQIQQFLDENLWRFDLGTQYLGDEPNVRPTSWESCSVRFLMVASWPYEQAAGNASIPTVYKAINDAREDFLCDRFYLPSTPRDMRMLEKAGIPVFGIETKHALTDFDVVGTSLSYPVLAMSFVKMLSMSGIPVRWRDRGNDDPFVLVGGQAYAAPEVVAPVVDAFYLGEAEDEEENPGIGRVMERISQFKQEGRWTTDRVGCYEQMAREFPYLYFPRFVAVDYEYQDRSHVGLEKPSKQVVGYRSLLEGMQMPFERHYVRDLDAIPPLDDAPLLYTDAGNASGDVEVARGCPAWSIPVDAKVEVAGRGSVRFDSVRPGEMIRVGVDYKEVAGVVVHGWKDTVRVTTRQGHNLRCTPEHEVYSIPGGSVLSRRQRDLADRVWVHAEDLQPGDLLLRTCGGVQWPSAEVSIEHSAKLHYVGRGRAERFYEEEWPVSLDTDVAWLLGMVTGDCIIRRNQVEFRVERRAPAVREKLLSILKGRFDIDVTEVPALSGTCDHIRANSARLVVWLGENFGIRQPKESRKIVPGQIFQSPRGVVGSYLSALFDSNGTALRPKSENAVITIRYAIYSESQVRGVAELLRMLGLPTAVRSEVRNQKRDGSVSDSESVKWEVRTSGSDDPSAYDWLESLEPFKSKDLARFVPPSMRASCQNHLQYVEVTGVEPDQPAQVMDVDVPGPQAFNVSGIYVHNCSFCRLSWVTKPYRQRSVDYMVEFGKSMKRNMGGTHLAYVAPDFPMHTEKKRLTKALVENVTDEVDGAAMRIDDFIADDQFVALSSYAGMDGVTLGLEGNCLSGCTKIQVPGVGIVSMEDASELQPKQVHSGSRVADVTDAYCSGVRSLSRVTLSDGTQIMATPEHLIRVVDGQPPAGRVYLTPEQRKARGITSNYLSKRGQLDDMPEAWHEVQDLRPGMYVRTYYGQMQWPVERWPGLTADVAWLLGVLSGDGRVEESGIEVRCDNSGVLERVIRVLTELGYHPRIKETSRAPMVTCYSKALAEFLAEFGVLDTDTKRMVPKQVMQSPRSVVAAYVSGVIDADGCVPDRTTQHGVCIVIGSHVEQFVRDVSELVRALGHPTSIRKNTDLRAGGYEMWHLTIRDAKDADWSWADLAETTRRQGLRDAQARVLTSRNTPQSDQGVAYARVVSVEAGVATERVFDLTVPDSNSFTANSVVVHNSQRMRDLVGKGVSDNEARDAVRRALEAGVRKVKLFMISNMPGEDEGDIERIVQLARDLAEIRDSMGKSNVVIQFSWTPLLIEANTPFQWFAPTPANYHLSHMWDAMRDLKIDSKIGAKSEVNKVTFFQLCQRASREIGEVLVDTMLELNVACWGGVPKRTRDLLDENMRKHGFLNGLEDAFDERGKDDLFGWEFISTGVSQSLLWDVYQQMVEFLEVTDSETYDEQFQDGEYHGAEWLPRCDERCLGTACGACTRDDLEIRKQYTQMADDDIDLATMQPIDERSVAVKIRAQVDKSEAYRLVTNDHWRFTLRRALYRALESTEAPANLVKRSIVFASDAIGFKDWTHGTDYVEFALTHAVPLEVLSSLFEAVNAELISPSGQEWMRVTQWRVHPPTAPSIRTDLDLTLYEVEVEEELSVLTSRVQWWDSQQRVDMTIRAQATYFGPTQEVVNAKDYVAGLWVSRLGHRALVKMLLRGRPSPYNVLAALMGKPSWLEYSRFPARRVDSFVAWDADQLDFFFPSCQECGGTIPVNVLEQAFDPDYCPQCKDTKERLIPV